MATNTTVTTTALPDWYTDASKKALTKAYAATGQPYPTRDFSRVAPFSDEQNQGFGMIQDNVGNWVPATDAGLNAVTDATNSKWTDPGVAASYMNPYTENVVNDIGKAAGRNLSENLLPKVNRTFVGGGTFGGSRSADFTARAVRDANESALVEQNRALASGYADAGKLYGEDERRGLEGGKTIAGIGGDIQDRAGKDAAAVIGVGAAKQGLAQTSADLAEKDFVEERDWDLNNAKSLVDMTHALSPTGASTVSKTEPGPNKTAEVIGGITTLAGTLGDIFGNKKPAPAKEGGVIRRARGGAMERLRIRYGIGG